MTLLHKKSKYYQLLDQPVTTLPNHSDTLSTSQLTYRVLHHHHYIFIDLNQDTAIKMMQPLDPQYSDDQGQKIGQDLIVTNLKNLSIQNQTTNRYLLKVNQVLTKKEAIRSKIKDYFFRDHQSQPKKQKYAKSFHTYPQVNTKKIKNHIKKQSLSPINQSIIRKQQRLVQKFGISNYQSITQQVKYNKNYQSIPQQLSSNKIKLPKILNNVRTIEN